MSIEKKVKKAKRGNEKAFQELIELEKNKLFRIAYLYVKNEADALDIVQDTIYKAFISIKRLKDPSYFSTWISRILINTCLDFIKKNSRVMPIGIVNKKSHYESLPLEDKLDLVEAIERLEIQYKTVIIFRYYKDLSIKQIAEILECPEGTVKTRLHRAVHQLKLDLKEECL
ncbi:sigma-70 family RNA polymerase sigma factor (plasmid) [Priestia megaterium]|jgi:RNA polymerase sigma-70 factor, ECF subfamily|uniref:sigma-70 family RNA polymerase sigma factor n=2 Tax=Priestia megaterium TaxID=1404 RepID=UPI0023D97B0B|nr:sigma-70 family RNA polymerase sigma factor [Priestia megaterium]MDF2053172.1 sigma-70 family RNA polymerase sigma factor [Priestia megaterium]MDF2062564.1 sigma-70 family RNA polymerase sigma factor [Priestia megaterium]MDH3177896.1 sigma-70 family RNA polymerase sigma factor [Priestia megaterium]